MRESKEKELENRLRKDLSAYFQIPNGQKAGKDKHTGRKVVPDIILTPLPITPYLLQSFNIEVKILKTDTKRRNLAEGFWQAYEQLHLTNYKDYKFDFALVASEESYTGISEEELSQFMYACIRIFSRKNVGWLDMQKGYPIMWMSKITKFTNDHGTWYPKPLWSARGGHPIDLKQLSLRQGSSTSNDHI